MERISLLLVFVINLLLVFFVNALPKIDPLVETSAGLVKGVRADNDEYSMFLGVPYGTVDFRHPFASSTPYPKFEQTFQAYDDSVVCPQKHEATGEMVGDIDCLRLNIFVPRVSSSANKLPVLVWIHGGSFEVGSGRRAEYDPKYLVNHGVIIVTINYRLGPYGFLCVDAEEVANNAGLKDQRLALGWIKENIANFGGNPNLITLAGESAGSISIDYHLRYLNNENLFHRVIMQSGTAQVFGATTQKAGDTYPIAYAAQLGFVTQDAKAAVAFLSTADPKLVVAAHNNAGVWLGACDETNFSNTDKYIDEDIDKKNVNVGSVSVLIGFNNEESLLSYASVSDVEFENRNIVKDRLERFFDFDNEEQDEMAAYVGHFYFGDETEKTNAKEGLVNFLSDISFAYPITTDIQEYMDNDVEAVYHYVFSYSGTRNANKIKFNVTEGGAAHFDDIGYLFERYDVPEPTSGDQLVIDRMTTLWTNFVKYGNPTPETTELLPVKWLPATRDSFNYLNINTELSLGRRPYHDRFAFWDIFFELNNDKKQHN